MDPRQSTATSHSQQHNGRPRAKLALLTWAGAYAVVLLVLAVGGRAMAGWPLALRALVVSGLMVAAMTWLIVPVVTRLFRGWRGMKQTRLNPQARSLPEAMKASGLPPVFTMQ